jgi:hypothetical protein
MFSFQLRLEVDETKLKQHNIYKPPKEHEAAITKQV